MLKWKNFDQFFRMTYTLRFLPPYFSLLIFFFFFLYRGKTYRVLLWTSAFKEVRKEAGKDRKGRKERKRGKGRMGREDRGKERERKIRKGKKRKEREEKEGKEEKRIGLSIIACTDRKSVV